MALGLYAHNPNSEGAAELARALGIRRIRAENSTYRGSPNKTVINWGSARLPEHIVGSRIINTPEAIARCSNKRSFFQTMVGATAPRVPEWTTDRAEAARWILEDNAVVCARTVLNGHSAEGLVILERGVDFVDAPLYTRYVPKREEWRVHIHAGEVIDLQRKIRRPEAEVLDWRVRNHDNGFIYARNVDAPNPDIPTQALRTMVLSGLDFGACDVIWNEHQGQAYVLEVNTAPGLSGQTVDNYANAFRRYL